MDCYKNRKLNDSQLVKAKVVRLIMDMNDNKLIRITDFFRDII